MNAELMKTWGAYQPGQRVTTDLHEVKNDGTIRVSPQRFEALRAGGYFASGAAQAEAMAEPSRLRSRRSLSPPAADPEFVGPPADLAGPLPVEAPPIEKGEE